MNEKMLYENFIRYAEDTIKEKDCHNSSFENRLGYKNAVGKLVVSILIIQQSYDEKSEYRNKFFMLYERLDKFFNSLKATEEWN
jgi:hypothetical protein